MESIADLIRGAAHVAEHESQLTDEDENRLLRLADQLDEDDELSARTALKKAHDVLCKIFGMRTEHQGGYMEIHLTDEVDCMAEKQTRPRHTGIRQEILDAIRKAQAVLGE